MKKFLTSVLLILLSLNQLNANAHDADIQGYQLPRTQVVPIKDAATGGQYELYIKLPEGYSEKPDHRYPVIYTTDAVWHIELLSASTAFLMENVVLVGISWQTDMQDKSKAHMSRFRDYSTQESNNPKIQAKYQMGQASKHLRFIRYDVMRYVEKHYRVDADNRTYFGYSLGGEFGAYALLSQPDTFKNYILGSPSLKGDIEHFSEISAQTKSKGVRLNANVFVSYGSQETELGKYAEQLINLLKNRNDESLSVTHEIVEGDHQAAFPITGVRSVTWLAGLQAEEAK